MATAVSGHIFGFRATAKHARVKLWAGHPIAGQLIHLNSPGPAPKMEQISVCVSMHSTQCNAHSIAEGRPN